MGFLANMLYFFAIFTLLTGSAIAIVILVLKHRKIPELKKTDKIHNFLRKNNVFPCGRFGEWEYFNMDHAINSGKKTAEEINNIYNKGNV